MTIVYDVGETLPDCNLTVLDESRATIALASGYTFVAAVIDADTAATAHTQSTAITGASTAPNIVIAWTSGFGSVAAGRYDLKVTATRVSDSKVRIFKFPLVVQ